MVLAYLEALSSQFGGEEHDERVPRILLELGPLVTVADVLDGQVVEFEGLLQEGVVVGVGGLDVEPEALLAFLKAGGQSLWGRLDSGALRRDQVPGN
jgi:hypothetical protein